MARRVVFCLFFALAFPLGYFANTMCGQEASLRP